MDKALHERFGDVGMGDPNPKPKPMITAGMITLPGLRLSDHLRGGGSPLGGTPQPV